MKKFMMEEMNEPEHKNSLGKMKKISGGKSSGKKAFKRGGFGSSGFKASNSFKSSGGK
jgi:hypothetical protein